MTPLQKEELKSKSLSCSLLSEAPSEVGTLLATLQKKEIATRVGHLPRDTQLAGVWQSPGL